MAGILAGALYGLGGGLQNVGGVLLKDYLETERAKMDEQRQIRLLELQERYRTAGLEAAERIKDRPRQEILAKANEPVRFRNVDESGDPYDDSYVDKSPRRMGIIASELGYGDIAKQYKELEEPGKAETLRLQLEKEKELRMAPSYEHPSQVSLRDAQAEQARAQAGYLQDAPSRESRLQNTANTQAVAAELRSIDTEMRDLTQRIAKANSDFAKESQLMKPDDKARAAHTLEVGGMQERLDQLRIQKDELRQNLRTAPAQRQGGRVFEGGPSQESIDLLKKNPSLADSFDATFGKGSAEKYLESKKGSSPPRVTAQSSAPSPQQRTEEKIREITDSPVAKFRRVGVGSIDRNTLLQAIRSGELSAEEKSRAQQLLRNLEGRAK